MLDVGPVGHGEKSVEADLAVFVDRLAAAGSDRPTALARAEIRRVIDTGLAPPGVRRLAEALSAYSAGRAPSPRRSLTGLDCVVAAMREHALVVLEGVEPAPVAASVGALVADGKRVVITGATRAELDAVRGELAADLAGRSTDRLPAVGPAQLRELRRLLVTATPARRLRLRQQLPDVRRLPATAEVAELCVQAERLAGADPATRMIPGLLAELDPPRRAAVTSVARLVHRALAALLPRSECEWAWTLLADLILTRHRAAFDRMLEDTAQAMAGIEEARRAAPVTFGSAPPPEALGVLRRYREFLGGGGRARTYFRSALQREVQPLLDEVRVGGRPLQTEDDVHRVIRHLELEERLRRVDTGCVDIGIPVPRSDGELLELSEGLVKVAAAVRSVGALRHDVLFLGSNSPVAVPDVESAARVAGAILEYEMHGSAADAVRRLETMADRLAGGRAAGDMAPEYERAVTALRERDVEGYATAVESLGAAGREIRDEVRRAELLQRLASVAPALAEAWTALAETQPGALGLAAFVPLDELLSTVPPPDSCDVVLVLGASALGVERLLVTAVAPRLIAVVGPDEQARSAPTLLSVLQRAAALVIRAQAAPDARVVPISAAAQARNGRATVGQAGA